MSPPKFEHCQPKYPVYHVPKVPFQPILRVPLDFGPRIAELRRLDYELDRFILNVRDYFDLVADAYASNVHYSTELEGNPLSLEEVRRLTRDSFQGRLPANSDVPRQEILNHLMTWLAPESFRLPWDNTLIPGVHRFLTAGVEAEDVPGEYRDGPAIITEGRDVVFKGADAETIEEELDALREWLNTQSPALHPLVAATMFFHEFESIHPFKDGNGRAGRTLFHLYLQSQGLKNIHLCKLEEELLGDARLYYRLLSWTDYAQDYTDLIDFVLDRTLTAYRKTHATLAEKDLLSAGLDEHAKRLLVRAKAHGDWFTVSLATAWVDDIQSDTVRRHLNRLVDLDALETEGRTRAKRYRFADPFVTLRVNLKQVAQEMAQARDSPSPAFIP